MPILQVLIAQGQQYFPAWLRGDWKNHKKDLFVCPFVYSLVQNCICLLVAV